MPTYEIPCSNLGCTELVARHDMLAHQHDKCKFQMVPCKYAALGCTVKVLRNDLDKKECDREHHVELAVNAVPDLQQQIIDQKETIDKLVAIIEMSKLTSDVKQQEIIKQQRNKLAQLQSIIFAQNKEISQLKVKIKDKHFISHCIVTISYNVM